MNRISHVTNTDPTNIETLATRLVSNPALDRRRITSAVRIHGGIVNRASKIAIPGDSMPMPSNRNTNRPVNRMLTIELAALVSRWISSGTGIGERYGLDVS